MPWRTSSALSQGSSQDNIGLGAPARHNVNRASSKKLTGVRQNDGVNTFHGFNVNNYSFHGFHVLVRD
jgi:hypothetical protein